MELGKIQAGMKVPNYRVLCRMMGEPVKRGNSKNAQLKEFSRFFSYTKEGNAFLIGEVYDIPKAQQDGRQKYQHLFEPLLLNFFSTCFRDESEKTWNRWFQTLGMVDGYFYDEAKCAEVVDFYRINTYSFYRLRNISKNKMKEMLSAALTGMKRRGLIDYDEYWRIISRQGLSWVARERDVRTIETAQQAALEEMECESLNSVYLSPTRYKEFSKKFHEKLCNKDTEWRTVFKEVRIKVLNGVAEKYRMIDPAPLKQELNWKVCGTVKKMAYREVEKQQEKTLAAWEEGIVTGFALSHQFTGDVEILVDQLMLLG